uniref:Uncharacterized protein n=1 Tax=Eutreptiella gymnastica TaxID=73025 RepID=A0A7S4CXH2_9EUGL|eukprot:CAMPEP_0174379306 /NCGR_PEP_ID=MMETSP0811_2-20130205/122623_1 /TAXON_ID=73025 ORGANISM="Eutreptiella gymnastica-like, Strain CCMP1594" /NCGR_SAMPLE_ID=MMETSP0811_2 /ASSEMBLY_ACC=CAM_ASM_000667 /LENGTH=984 /DNA_ID=CAMNT_0015531803 /DNA_START=30 /DNA_END=2984 /DNA_ORIENTATION=+
MAGSYIRNAEVERKMALGLYYLCQTKAFRSDPDCEDFQDLYLADFGFRAPDTDRFDGGALFMVLTLGGFCTFIVYHVVLDRIAKARSRRKSNGACRYKSGKLPGDRRQALWISCLATTLSFLNSWKCKAEKVYVGFLECVLSQREATREKTPVDPRLALLESEYALRATISVQAKIEGELTAVLQEEVGSRSACEKACLVEFRQRVAATMASQHRAVGTAGLRSHQSFLTLLLAEVEERLEMCESFSSQVEQAWGLLLSFPGQQADLVGLQSKWRCTILEKEARARIRLWTSWATVRRQGIVHEGDAVFAVFSLLHTETVQRANLAWQQSQAQTLQVSALFLSCHQEVHQRFHTNMSLITRTAAAERNARVSLCAIWASAWQDLAAAHHKAWRQIRRTAARDRPARSLPTPGRAKDSRFPSIMTPTLFPSPAPLTIHVTAAAACIKAAWVPAADGHCSSPTPHHKAAVGNSATGETRVGTGAASASSVQDDVIVTKFNLAAGHRAPCAPAVCNPRPGLLQQLHTAHSGRKVPHDQPKSPPSPVQTCESEGDGNSSDVCWGDAPLDEPFWLDSLEPVKLKNKRKQPRGFQGRSPQTRHRAPSLDSVDCTPSAWNGTHQNPASPPQPQISYVNNPYHYVPSPHSNGHSPEEAWAAHSPYSGGHIKVAATEKCYGYMYADGLDTETVVDGQYGYSYAGSLHKEAALDELYGYVSSYASGPNKEEVADSHCQFVAPYGPNKGEAADGCYGYPTPYCVDKEAAASGVPYVETPDRGETDEMCYGYLPQYSQDDEASEQGCQYAPQYMGNPHKQEPADGCYGYAAPYPHKEASEIAAKGCYGYADWEVEHHHKEAAPEGCYGFKAEVGPQLSHDPYDHGWCKSYSTDPHPPPPYPFELSNKDYQLFEYSKSLRSLDIRADACSQVEIPRVPPSPNGYRTRSCGPSGPSGPRRARGQGSAWHARSRDMHQGPTVFMRGGHRPDWDCGHQRA